MSWRGAEDIRKRYQRAKANQENWRSLYQDVFKLCMPNRDLYETTNPGQDRMDGVYTSVGITAANSFVNRLISSMTPPFKKWATLSPGPGIKPSERDSVQEQLDALTDIVFSYINSSNFNQAVSEAYHDLVAGTCCLLIMPGDIQNPINFASVPIAQIALEKGANGTVGAVYRCYELEGELIKQQWPDADYTPKKDNECDKLNLIESTYYDYEEKNYKYCILLEEEKQIIVKRVYTTNPWIVLRWDKMPEEVYGRGPGLFALADIKMLNKISEYSIRAFALKVFPPFTVADDSVLDPDKFLLQPAALNIVERNAGPNGPSIMPLQVGGDVNLEQYKTDELKLSIKKQMLDDQLPSDAGPVRTATEVSERIRQQQVDIGGAFGRIMTEFIRPLLMRCIDVLYKQNLIPAVIDMKDFDEYMVKVEILSPLARQQYMEDLQGATQAVQLLGMVSPQLLDTVIDLEPLAEYMSNNLGVPARFIRGDKQRKEHKDQLKEAMDQQIANEAAVQTTQKVIENETKK